MNSRPKNNRYARLAMTAAFLLVATEAYAATPCERTPMLESDKPNLIGWTKDNGNGDDHSYFDINISMKAPLFYGYYSENDQHNCSPYGKWLPYFGVNLVAAFYAVPGDRRTSSPVIGKEFNPFLRFRHFIGTSDVSQKDDWKVEYFDYEYGHLSNGQAIETLDGLNATAAAVKNTRYAQDYISRGWDYLGTNIHWYFEAPIGPQYQAVTISLRKYIGGLFQGSIEEFNSAIEQQRSIRGLNQVSGIRVSDKIGIGDGLVGSVSLTLDTGLDAPLKRNSIRIDTELFSNYFHPKTTGISFDVWLRSGYAANLAHYYQRINSVGMAFLFETFRGSQAPSAPALIQQQME